jgi:hypothetical protein
MTASDKVYKNTKGNYKVTPTLTDSNGKTLKSGVDYTDIVYTSSGNQPLDKNQTLEKGSEVTVTVTGKGNYTGSISATYRIVANDIKYATVKIPNQTYSGTDVTLNEDDITVKSGKNTLIFGEDYEIVGYTNNNKTGTATVTIKGIGEQYGGTKAIRFYIKPAKVSWWWSAQN